MRVWSYLLVVYLFSSCASSKLDKKELRSVKRVAVVGFLITQDKVLDTNSVKEKVQDGLAETALNLLGFGSNSSEDKPMFESENITKNSKHSEVILKNFSERLKSELEWDILHNRKLTRSKGYSEIHKKIEKRYYFSNSRGSKNVEKFKSSSSFHPLSLSLMPLEDRDKLIESLGVDALIAIDYKVNLSRESIVGENMTAKANLKFHLYKKGIRESIVLKEYEGELVSDAKAKVGFIGYANNSKLVNSLIVKSTHKPNTMLFRELKGNIESI